MGMNSPSVTLTGIPDFMEASVREGVMVVIDPTTRNDLLLTYTYSRKVSISDVHPTMSLLASIGNH